MSNGMKEFPPLAAGLYCNLQFRLNPKTVRIPCIIHNLRGYDSHLILSAVKHYHGKIKVIPNNVENTHPSALVV